MESSRGYLVDTNGTYLYHEDSDLVGTQMTDNPVIEEVLRVMREEGHITTADVRTCKDDGKDMYVAFMCTVNDWVIYVLRRQSRRFSCSVSFYTLYFLYAVIALVNRIVFSPAFTAAPSGY